MGPREDLPRLTLKMECKISLPVFFLFLGLFQAAPGRAQQPPGPLDLLKQLNTITLDPARIYAIRDAHIIVDRLSIYLHRGFIAFMSPVDGEVTGAVFSGEGEVLMIPPDRAEKRNLALFTHAAILEERISSAYLRFTDQTAKELMAASSPPDPDDLEQPPPFIKDWSAASVSFDTSVRILTDLLGDRTHPYFYARVDGDNLGLFDIIYDQRLAEPLSIGTVRKVGSEEYTDVWCSFGKRGTAGEEETPPDVTPKPQAYTLEVRIHSDHSLEGQAEIQMESRSDKDRVISFELSRWLTVTAVEDDRGRQIPLIQDSPQEGHSGESRNYDHIEVVLPHPIPLGEHFRLVFHYHGTVIEGMGNGVLYVGARGSWYPNLGMSKPCRFDMTFHYPRKLVLVATGARIDQTTSDELTTSRWRSDGVFRVAGFNLGPYTSVERHAGKTSITVYATHEAESALEDQHAMAFSPPIVVAGPHRSTLTPPSPPSSPLTPSALLNTVADVAADSVRYFSSLFGPYPYPRLEITQVPGEFGQGWPELVYLSTLSFLPKVERSEITRSRTEGDPMGPTIIAHEIAHQWWGNLLGWQTYHDQWLSEGLATYSAALFLAQSKDGSREFRNVLHMYKENLLAKTPEGATIESGGPIWLGQRLSSSVDPAGYATIAYKKACWVLHMLRELMTDPKTGSDARFFEMLRDFATRYQGQSVSTQDFIEDAERFMPAESDLEHNHKLDWFFDEWVYDTGIPTYTLKTEGRDLANGQYVVQGTISQSGVPEDFEMPVRIVALYGKDRRTTLGRVVVGDGGGEFKYTLARKPMRVMIDEETLLAVEH